MITMMGITAQKNDIQMGNVDGEIQKTMASAPRRISHLGIQLNFSNHNLNDTEKALLESTALSCPVTRRLHPDIIVEVKINYLG